MKNLMRRLSKVADSSQYCLLRPESYRKGSGVPEGHVPVYVGDEMERFVVNAELVNHPIFVKLLNKTAAEYGYEQKGVLRIPCHVYLFKRVLEAAQTGADARELQELLHSLSEDL